MKWFWWGLLVAVTGFAWWMYATQHWRSHEQGNHMHLLLFSMWTVTWFRALAASGLRGRLAWGCAAAVPPGAAGVGELVQLVWHGGGHTAEWRGFFASVGGVAIGGAVALAVVLVQRWRARRA